MPTHILYFNGLGSGHTRRLEQLAMRYLAKRSLIVTHVPINWYTTEPFDQLLSRLVALTKTQLKTHGRLVLVGSSAGGSLAINILGQIIDPDLTAITLCSRLHEAPLPWWDQRSLARMAHLDTNRPSQAFYDSVTYCDTRTIPHLTAAAKRRLIITRQWADFVVPRPTMTIPGVRVYQVPALGHGWGIAMATQRLPHIITNILKN